MPALQEVYAAKHGQFELISVAVDENNDPRGFVEQNGYDWRFAIDQGGAQLYNVQFIPLTIFIDKNGNEITRSDGGMDPAAFEAKLAQIL